MGENDKMIEDRFLRLLSKMRHVPYHPNAYNFVLNALRYTQCHYNKPRHVTGQELLVGVARMAKDQYGDLACTVLEEWGITSARDFGNIVFHLVELGEIKKTDEDRIEDFDIDFDLHKEITQIESSASI